MGKIVGVFLIMILTYTGLKFSNSSSNNIPIMKSIYEIPLNDINGKPFDLIQFKGKYILFVNVASKCGFTKQYKALIKSENVEIVFNDDALEEISHKAYISNSEIENIGARRLHTVMSKLLNEILFDIPEKIGPNAKIVITKKMVEEKLNSITKNKDLSEYIL